MGMSVEDYVNWPELTQTNFDRVTSVAVERGYTFHVLIHRKNFADRCLKGLAEWIRLHDVMPTYELLGDNHVFSFKDGKDAMLFKLAWA